MDAIQSDLVDTYRAFLTQFEVVECDEVHLLTKVVLPAYPHLPELCRSTLLEQLLQHWRSWKWSEALKTTLAATPFVTTRCARVAP